MKWDKENLNLVILLGSLLISILEVFILYKQVVISDKQAHISEIQTRLQARVSIINFLTGSDKWPEVKIADIRYGDINPPQISVRVKNKSPIVLGYRLRNISIHEIGVRIKNIENRYKLANCYFSLLEKEFNEEMLAYQAYYPLNKSIEVLFPNVTLGKAVPIDRLHLEKRIKALKACIKKLSLSQSVLDEVYFKIGIGVDFYIPITPVEENKRNLPRESFEYLITFGDTIEFPASKLLKSQSAEREKSEG